MFGLFNLIIVFLVFLAGAVVAEDAQPNAEKKEEDILEQLRHMLEQTEQGSEVAEESLISVYFNGAYQNDITAKLSVDGDLLKVKYIDLVKVLRDINVPSRKFAELQDWEGWISKEHLDKHLELYLPKYDPEKISFYLETEAGAREEGTISLKEGPRYDFTDVILPQKFSAYVNLRNFWNVPEKSKTRYNLHMNGVARVHKLVFEGDGRWQPHVDSGKEFIRNSTRCIIDFPENITRLTLGDVFGHSRGLPTNSLGGINYETRFEMDPNIITHPIIDSPIFLDRDSSVQVIMNGKEFRTFDRKAGPYSIKRFPLTPGLNDIELVIKDDLGNVEVKKFEVLVGPSLLAPGLSEYSHFFGFKRVPEGYDKKEWRLGTYYKRGLFNFMDVFVAGLLTPHLGAARLGSDFAAPWFTGHGDIIGAKTSHGTDFTTGLLLSRRFTDWLNISYQVRYTGKKYMQRKRRLPTDTSLKLSQSIFFNFRLGKLGTLSIRHTDSRFWDKGPERGQRIQWRTTFFRNFRVHATYIHRHDALPTNEWEAGITYSFSTDKIGRSFLADRRFDGGYLLGANFTGNKKDWLVNWGLSYRRSHDKAGIWLGDVANVNVNYPMNRYHWSYHATVNKFWDENIVNQGFALNTTIAYADGKIAFGGRRLGNSFAILSQSPELGRRTRLQTREVYSTIRMGALVPLGSYVPTDLRVEAMGAAADLNDLNFKVLPSYKSGFHLEVKGRGIGVAKGVLYDLEGEPIELDFLLVYRVDQPDEEPIFSFTNNDGNFRIPGLILGKKYFILDEEAGLQFSFEMPEKVPIDEEYDLGDLYPMD